LDGVKVNAGKIDWFSHLNVGKGVEHQLGHDWSTHEVEQFWVVHHQVDRIRRGSVRKDLADLRYVKWLDLDDFELRWLAD